MSDNSETGAVAGTELTTDQVNAAAASAARDPAALDKAVASSHAAAAPASETDKRLSDLEAAVADVQQVLGTLSPIVNQLAPMVAGAIPVAGPILARLPLIESTVQAILTAISSHFGPNKIVGMPTEIQKPAAASE
jgi:hypothetical protein